MGAPGTTPGPWFVMASELQPSVNAGGTSLAMVRVKDGLPVAVAIANANLIAASPELYDALVNARQWVLSFPVVVDHARQTMLAQIDAALAKARGEA